MKQLLAVMLVCSMTHPCCASDRELLAQKTEYLAKTDAATTDYLKAIADEIGRLTKAGGVDDALRLRQHRGQFLLGRQSPRDAIAPDSTALSDGFRAAAETCAGVLDSERMALQTRYQQEVDEAAAAGNLSRAEQLKGELAAFESAEYAPSALELARKKPFAAARYTFNLQTFVKLDDPSLPDELVVDSQSRRFRFHGTCRHDVVNIKGERCGHQGKAVILNAGPTRAAPAHGYFQILINEKSNTYGLGIVQGSKLAPVLRFDDLDLNTVYEWQVVNQRNAWVFDVLKDGAVVRTGTVPAPPRASIGFYANVRFVGNKTDFIVAIDE
ncbi:MAG: hypothetical protein ACK5Q5_18625 [Planctomycetaceae bacterium]